MKHHALLISGGLWEMCRCVSEMEFRCKKITRELKTRMMVTDLVATGG